MTKTELSLLLYLETRAVDHGGAVDTRHMNEEDAAIAGRWNRSGYLQFGRMSSKDIKERGITHWCFMSDQAMADAHAERKARAARTFAKYYSPNGYIPTKEKRNV